MATVPASPIANRVLEVQEQDVGRLEVELFPDQEDVGRLDVPVHDAARRAGALGLVQLRQRAGEGRRQPHRDVGRQRTAIGSALLEVDTRVVVHDDARPTGPGVPSGSPIAHDPGDGHQASDLGLRLGVGQGAALVDP